MDPSDGYRFSLIDEEIIHEQSKYLNSYINQPGTHDTAVPVESDIGAVLDGNCIDYMQITTTDLNEIPQRHNSESQRSELCVPVRENYCYNITNVTTANHRAVDVDLTASECLADIQMTEKDFADLKSVYERNIENINNNNRHVDRTASKQRCTEPPIKSHVAHPVYSSDDEDEQETRRIQRVRSRFRLQNDIDRNFETSSIDTGPTTSTAMLRAGSSRDCSNITGGAHVISTPGEQRAQSRSRDNSESRGIDVNDADSDYEFIQIIKKNFRTEKWLRSFSKVSTKIRLCDNVIDEPSLKKAFEELVKFVKHGE